MGLDMYLKKRIYVGAEYEHRKVTGKIEIQVNGKPLNVDFKKVSYIEENAGYWRKANAIHNWFVENVQDGVDECQSSPVSKEQLEELLGICKRVVERAKLVDGKLHASTSYENGKEVKNYENGKIIENADEIAELLPTASGFFFGGTDYTEWYLRDVKDTIAILEEAIKNGDNCEYEYRASW